MHEEQSAEDLIKLVFVVKAGFSHTVKNTLFSLLTVVLYHDDGHITDDRCSAGGGQDFSYSCESETCFFFILYLYIKM